MTLKSLVDLAQCQKDQGRPHEADRLLRNALDGAILAFGPCHPETLRVQLLFAECLEAQIRMLLSQGEESANKTSTMPEQPDASPLGEQTRSQQQPPPQPKVQVHGDSFFLGKKQQSASVPSVGVTGGGGVERSPKQPCEEASSSLEDLIVDCLQLRRSVACALEEQQGPEHPRTLEAVESLADAMERWATVVLLRKTSQVMPVNKGGIRAAPSHPHEDLMDHRQQQQRSSSSSLAADALEQVTALREAAAAGRAAAGVSPGLPSRALFVPPYLTGQSTGKGKPPTPQLSCVIDDFAGGSLGIFSR